MSPNIARELAALQRLTVPQLRARYAEVFSELFLGYTLQFSIVFECLADKQDVRFWLLHRYVFFLSM